MDYTLALAIVFNILRFPSDRFKTDFCCPHTQTHVNEVTHTVVTAAHYQKKKTHKKHMLSQADPYLDKSNCDKVSLQLH